MNGGCKYADGTTGIMVGDAGFTNWGSKYTGQGSGYAKVGSRYAEGTTGIVVGDAGFTNFQPSLVFCKKITRRCRVFLPDRRNR